MRSLVPSLLSAEEELLISNTVLIGNSFYGPYIFNHQLSISRSFYIYFICSSQFILQSFAMTVSNRYQFLLLTHFQPLSIYISRSFISFALHCLLCSILPWQSVSSSYCRYQSLSHSPPQQNFWQLFFSFPKVCGYPTSLIQ